MPVTPGHGRAFRRQDVRRSRDSLAACRRENVRLREHRALHLPRAQPSIAASGSGVDSRVFRSMQTSVARPVAAQTPSWKIACATLNEERPNSASAGADLELARPVQLLHVVDLHAHHHEGDARARRC